MRRYLGNTWLSLAEAANVLRWSEASVMAAVSIGQLPAVWRRGPILERGGPRQMVPYVSAQQVSELERRLSVLDAAFSDWPSSD